MLQLLDLSKISTTPLMKVLIRCESQLTDWPDWCHPAIGWIGRSLIEGKESKLSRVMHEYLVSLYN